jgi:iron complex outermembrane receptor protein
VAKGAGLGLLGNRDVMDAPFNITSYTQQVIADQQSATVAAVLENDPSVRFTTNAGHAYENYTIRGLEVNSSDVSLNGLYGMAPDGHIPTEMLERVEVLKGRARCSTAWRRAAPWAAS